ncbi:putative membrane protein [Clostridium bornimense]|uniref:Putative membrane protein n=1 Tax=Clostridium bornimense TaxID=1216932 RepID=W6RWR6_9CLOT|nr:AI-2E family transporter [Clostridium bornimense]CDM69126.1 putative membrane protein [Clostridium bornimense]
MTVLPLTGRKREIFKIAKRVLIIVATIFILYLCFKIKIIRSLCEIAVISFFLAYLLKPSVEYLNNKGLNKKLASMIIVGTLIGIFAITLGFFIPEVIREASNLREALYSIEGTMEKIVTSFDDIHKNKFIGNIVDKGYIKAQQYVLLFSEKIIDSVVKITSYFIELTVIPVAVYYFLSEGKKMFNRTMVLVPIRYRGFFKKIAKDIDVSLTKYISSQLILSLVVVVLTFILLVGFKIKFPLILSIINGILNIIPYFGPIIGTIPILIIALISSRGNFIYLLVGLYIIQMIESNIISPKVTGDSIDMHPLLIVIVLYIGGEVAGFMGMVLSVPVAVLIKVIYQDVNSYF